jgi:hypothetical protein
MLLSSCFFSFFFFFFFFFFFSPAALNIYRLYLPRTYDHQLPLSFGKGSRAALIRHVREHEGAEREQQGSTA